MYTTQQIIDNQKNYRKLILKWLTDDLRRSKKELLEIKSKDKFIQSEVEKLKGKFNKTKQKKEIDRLFFMHSNRNKEFYAWWDEQSQEVFILSYGKR